MNSITSTLLKMKDKKNNNILIEKIPTGFSNLDSILGGGYQSGLHFVGATPSAGKTAFVLQVMRNMAQSGKECIFFSLEMMEAILVSKLLSMQSFIDSDGDANMSYPSNFLLDSKSRMKLTNDDWARIFLSSEHIEKFSDRIHIIDNDTATKSISSDYIYNSINEFVIETGKHPVVFIDYLQIIAQPERHYFLSDKQMIDYDISKLRQLAFLQHIPVILISSVNRESYDNRGISIQSSKGTGDIEYSAETMLSLNRLDFNRIDLNILKRKDGISGQTLKYYFFPEYNFFSERTCKKIKI